MARGLQIFVLMAIMTATGFFFAGCVIPPPLDIVDENTPPRIDFESTFPDPTKQPGLTVFQTKPGEPLVRTRFTISFYDPDPESVTMRAFLGLPPYRTILAENTIPRPSSSGLRAGPMEIVGLCDDIVNKATGTYFLWVYVSDTGFVNGPNEDLRTPATVDGRKGGQDSVAWEIKCDLPGGS